MNARRRSRTFIAAALWVIAVLAFLMGLQTFFRPPANGEVAKDAFGVLLVSFGAACSFAAYQARLIRRAALPLWLAATEVGRDLIWGVCLAVGLGVVSAISPDSEVRTFFRDIVNQSASILGIGSWMLLVGKFVVAQSAALEDVNRTRPGWARRAADPGGGRVTIVTLLVLAVVSLVIASAYIVGVRIEMPLYFITVSTSVFAASLMIGVAIFGVLLAAVLIAFREIPIPAISPLRSLPRQLIVVEATAVAAFAAVILAFPRESDVLSLLIVYAGTILTTVLLVSIPGEYTSAFVLAFVAWRRKRADLSVRAGHRPRMVPPRGGGRG